MKTEVDTTLREEQAGLRQDRSCTDHIATLWIIVEQSNQQKENQDIRPTCENPMMLEGERLEEVESFRYLGSLVDTRGGTKADVITRISKTRATFHILRNVWKSRIIGKTTKMRLFNTNVKSVLLCGAEALVGVLSDVNLDFIVQMFPLAHMQFRAIQDI